MNVDRIIDDMERRLGRVEAQAAKLPTRIGQSVGGGGGSGWRPYEADSEEELNEEYPDVPESSLGYIKAGPLKGSWWGRLDGAWRPLTVWRAYVPPEEEE
jgi:hypothetical protein